MFSIGIITASDKGSRGEREDASGRLIATMMRELGEMLYEFEEPFIVDNSRFEKT